MAPRSKSLREIFAKNIRELRKRRGLTQGQLAKASKLSTKYISLLENKDRNVTIDAIEAIGKALGVHPVELFDDGTRPDASPAKVIRDTIRSLEEYERKLLKSVPSRA